MFEHRTPEGITRERTDILRRGRASDCVLWRHYSGDEAVDYSKLAVMCEMVDKVMATEADITCIVHTTLCDLELGQLWRQANCWCVVISPRRTKAVHALSEHLTGS